MIQLVARKQAIGGIVVMLIVSSINRDRRERKRGSMRIRSAATFFCHELNEFHQFPFSFRVIWALVRFLILFALFLIVNQVHSGQ